MNNHLNLKWSMCPGLMLVGCGKCPQVFSSERAKCGTGRMVLKITVLFGSVLPILLYFGRRSAVAIMCVCDVSWWSGDWKSFCRNGSALFAAPRRAVSPITISQYSESLPSSHIAASISAICESGNVGIIQNGETDLLLSQISLPRSMLQHHSSSGLDMCMEMKNIPPRFKTCQFREHWGSYCGSDLNRGSWQTFQ